MCYRYCFPSILVLFLLLSRVSSGQAYDQLELDSLKTQLIANPSQSLKRVELLNKLCKKYWVVSVDTSIIYGRQALEGTKHIDNKTLKANVHRNLGTAYLYSGNFENAYKYYSNSLEISKELGDKIGINKSLNNIGLVYKNIGNYGKALKFYSQSLALKKELKDYKGIGNTLNNLGAIYSQLKDFDKALKYYEEALDYNMRSSNSRMKINSFIHMGGLFEAKKDYDAARHYFRKAIRMSKVEDNYNGLSHGYIGMGNIFTALSNYDSAMYYYRSLLAIKNQLNNAKLFGNGHYKIAELYFKTSKYDSALHHLNIRHKLAQSIDQQEFLVVDYELYARIYEAKGDYQQAYIYKSNFQDLRDNIYNEQLLNRLVDVNLEQQAADHQKKLDEKNSQISSTRIWLAVSLLLMLLAIFASYIYFNKLKLNQKVNDLLEAKVKKRTKMLNQKNIELSLSNQELDNFVYKTSHDLRGPVARIQGLINLSSMKEAELGDQEKYFTLLNMETVQMHKTLDKLNKIHDINLHNIQLVSASIRNEIQRIISEQPSSNMQTEFKNEVPETLIWGIDKFLFEIILGGLIEHAQANTAPGNHFIKITAEKMGNDNLRFLVIDNGSGIPEEAVSKIFDMFYQASPKSTHSGLVLYMAKKAVEKFGGEIKVLNPQNDTIFEFSIPSI